MREIKQRLSAILGQDAETRACKYLQTQGLQLVIKNYRCRSGEIDLIMQDHHEWVFVEVKYRSRTHFGHPAEYFDTKKRRKFESAMFQYMQQKGLNPALVPHRIDLIAITGKHIQWIKQL
ncbi:YraN family protein [Lacimicrobium sp. SS2-24]|uniref:YraN family protein n=1 Tax=Lacimicrobium sp. SS2-24 TaxID=2005569 RepID=UPI000B4BB591|nr:YraN family protein [Lacimicrobium sp. SS2-24]